MGEYYFMLGRVFGHLLVCSIPEVIHLHGQSDGIIGVREKRLAILGNQGEVIKWIKFVKHSGFRLIVILIIIHEPACHIRVQCIGNRIK